ncbi:LuxR C-terminal-related transcriptional regulator [Dyadobacter sp. CY312]|uniref:LuxR C-terminal-related transcriptional regulator n=1 Tax=Dyadobacter sp. CY312 TaxID=2907303 RepID=UPI001F225D83|nr:LuxR C-terminal-related transcriptional regulator [Dyadobacter sp. CY312]MCE7038896.1 LuxR C-terminal-related transcriptional regulator [Dyadobacter sp. CY312]
MERNTDLSLQIPGETTNWGYGIGGKQLALVKAMAQLCNSGVTIYDLKKGVHIYTSSSFYRVFGFQGLGQQNVPNEVFDSRVHPDDLRKLAHNGALAMRYIMKLPACFRRDYKMITEYRIRNSTGDYIQVTEQHHVLELDRSGNVSLSLGVIDVSPNQAVGRGVQFQLINCHNGELVDLMPKEKPVTKDLTLREKQILEMIRSGNLSKEISHMLSISVHTVNTHRQRILEKLNAGNAMEAVLSARSKGIIV